MDIQQAMMLLQGAQQGGMQQAPQMAPPDYNAILQQQLVNQQAEQAAMGQLGGGMGPQPDIGALIAQQMQAQQAPMAFGAQPPGGLGNMAPPQPPGPPQPPVGTAQLPGGGMAGALRMAPPPQGGPAAY